MSENTSLLRRIGKFPDTKAQKTVTGALLVALFAVLLVAGVVTQDRGVQTWAIIGLVPLIAGVILLISASRKAGQ